MEHYPSVLTREESDRFVSRAHPAPVRSCAGSGPWAVEVPGVTSFAGYVGLLEHPFEAPFTPCVEVGWRLAFPLLEQRLRHGGRHRPRSVHGFDVAGLDEIVSFTALTNARSIAVMVRLGVAREGEFDHPRLPAGHPLRRHILYRLSPYKMGGRGFQTARRRQRLTRRPAQTTRRSRPPTSRSTGTRQLVGGWRRHNHGPCARLILALPLSRSLRPPAFQLRQTHREKPPSSHRLRTPPLPTPGPDDPALRRRGQRARRLLSRRPGAQREPCSRFASSSIRSSRV